MTDEQKGLQIEGVLSQGKSITCSKSHMWWHDGTHRIGKGLRISKVNLPSFDATRPELQLRRADIATDALTHAQAQEGNITVTMSFVNHHGGTGSDDVHSDVQGTNTHMCTVMCALT